MVASLARRAPPSFPVTPVAPRPVGDATIAGRVTLDARDAGRWTRFDFSRASAVTDGDPLGWDVAARRFRLIANGGEGFAGDGGALELAQPWESVRELPAEGYVGSRVTPGGDSVHAVLDGWYRYGFFSHLLEPRPVTYAVRTADGRYARLRILGYYCPGAEPGCLTFEYAYRGDGGRVFPTPPAPEPVARPVTAGAPGASGRGGGAPTSSAPTAAEP